jgi:hypothetical protein
MIARHQRPQVLHPSDTGLAVPELTSPSMNRTRWPEIYRNCRRDILVRLTDVGLCWLHSQDVRLGCHDSIDMFSPVHNEKRIWILLQAVDQALDRCEDTMRSTGRPILCWLASTKSNEFCPRPFTFLSRKASRQRYRRLWKKFIAFAFRLYHLPAATRESACGIKLSDDQLKWLGEVWNDRCWNHVELEGGPISHGKEDEEDCEASDDEECDDEEDSHQEQDDAILESDDEMEAQIDGLCEEVDGTCKRRVLPSSHVDLQNDIRVVELHKTDISAKRARDRISELIFRFRVFSAAEEFTDGQTHSSLLVYYAGILGLSADGRTFWRAKDYTPKLSGLIYIQRLLFLEAALPRKAYENITIGRRAQRAHLERLNEVRMRYMVRGCLSPFGEFQSLRDYGQVIARSDPPAFMFRWSEDYQTLHYGDDSLSMEQLRSFASRIVSSSTMLCARLMYDWQPEFDLKSIKDDLCNLQEGFSFIDHPSNELSSAYLELSTRACTHSSNGLLVDDNSGCYSIPFRARGRCLHNLPSRRLLRRVDRSLYYRHRGCRFYIRRAVAQRLQSFTMPQTLDEVRPRPDGVPPLEFLARLQLTFAKHCVYLCPRYRDRVFPRTTKSRICVELASVLSSLSCSIKTELLSALMLQHDIITRSM